MTLPPTTPTTRFVVRCLTRCSGTAPFMVYGESFFSEENDSSDNVYLSIALSNETNALHAVFGSDSKTVELSIYPESSFFTSLGRQAEHVMPVSSKHLHVLITVGKFIKNWPDLTQFLWEKQRDINHERVDEIITYLDSKPVDTQAVNQCITIALVNNKEPRVIDGQHRLWALSQMDEDTKFLIQCVNFSSNDERFIEFVKINSNTPLPDYYKSITKREEFYVVIADQYTKAILDEFPHLVSSTIKYGFFTREQLKTEIFQELSKRNPEMSVDIDMNEILHLLNDKTTFREAVVYYPIPSINIQKCAACRSKDNRLEQCFNSPKVDGYCGMHKSKKYPFQPRTLRNTRFKELDEVKSGFFILDPKWLDKVMDTLYPPLIGF